MFKRNKFQKSALYPFFLLLCLGLIWGTSFSIARFAMESGITPLGYLFWQTVGPACLLYLLIFLIQKKPFAFKRNQAVFYLITSLLGILCPNYIMFLSAKHLPSGILGLIVNTSPIVTYLLSLLFVIERFKFKRFLGIVLGVCGLYFLFAPQARFVYSNNVTWIIFAFLVPTLLALCTIFIVKFKTFDANALDLACGMLIFSAILVVPITFSQGAFHSMTTLSIPNLIILLEILLSTIGFILFFELLRVSGPVYYSLVSCLVALSGLGWGYLIFHESLFGTEAISILLTITAIYLVGQNGIESK